MTNQMDQMMNQMMQQVTQGQTITPEVQKQIDAGRAEAMSMVKEILDWQKLEPMYIRVYQKSFTQKEVNDLIAMYHTPGAEALVNKMPVVMQNTMSEMRPLMQPILQRMVDQFRNGHGASACLRLDLRLRPSRRRSDRAAR